MKVKIHDSEVDVAEYEDIPRPIVRRSSLSPCRSSSGIDRRKSIVAVPQISSEMRLAELIHNDVLPDCIAAESSLPRPNSSNAIVTVHDAANGRLMSVSSPAPFTYVMDHSDEGDDSIPMRSFSNRKSLLACPVPNIQQSFPENIFNAYILTGKSSTKDVQIMAHILGSKSSTKTVIHVPDTPTGNILLHDANKNVGASDGEVLRKMKKNQFDLLSVNYYEDNNNDITLVVVQTSPIPQDKVNSALQKVLQTNIVNASSEDQSDHGTVSNENVAKNGVSSIVKYEKKLKKEAWILFVILLIVFFPVAWIVFLLPSSYCSKVVSSSVEGVQNSS